MIAALAAAAITAACERTFTIKLSDRACSVSVGDSTDEVLAKCGPPDGLSTGHQAAINDNASGDSCRPRAYDYPDAFVLVDCNRRVTGVAMGDAREPFKGRPDADFLIAELRAGRDVEAALVMLAHVAPEDPRTLEFINELAASTKPSVVAAVAKARKVTTR